MFRQASIPKASVPTSPDSKSERSDKSPNIKGLLCVGEKVLAHVGNRESQLAVAARLNKAGIDKALTMRTHRSRPISPN